MVNWKEMQMKFNAGSQIVTLQGDSSLHRTLVSLQSIVKTVDVEYCGVVWTRWAVGDTSEEQRERVVWQDD